MALLLTGGQVQESTQLDALLDAIAVPKPDGRGPVRRRPDRVIADRGYSYRRCRETLRRRRIAHVIPERRDQIAVRSRRPGRKPSFDRTIYARRNVVERCMARLKQWRGIATRFEKRAAQFRAMVVIAALMIWLTTDSSDTP